jgi:hypothetical protein
MKRRYSSIGAAVSRTVTKRARQVAQAAAVAAAGAAMDYVQNKASAVFKGTKQAPRQPVMQGTPTRSGVNKTKSGGRMHRYNYGSSRLKGFIKVKRSNRRAMMRKGKLTTTGGLNKGVTYHKESGGTIDSKMCRYFGHSTMPIRRAALNAMIALLKTAHVTNGKQFNEVHDDWVDQYPSLVNVIITVTRSDVFPNTMTTYVLPLDGLTKPQWIDLADHLINEMKTIFDTYGGACVFDNIDIQGQANTPIFLRIPLNSGYFIFNAKSTLKVQNRSVGASGNVEEDAVDNVPLNGYAYEGSGTGMRPSAIGLNSSWLAFDLDAGSKFGDILQSEPGFTEFRKSILSEPQNANMFSNVRKSDKVRMDPGDVRTSTLSSYNKLSFRAFFAVALEHYTGNNHKKHIYIGKYRIFALEKVLETNVVTNEVSWNSLPTFRIAVEHDLKLQTTAVFTQRNVTAQWRDALNAFG